MSVNPVIIAIDGPSASGKGTIAKRLAAHFDFAHLDTGLLYRAVGVAVRRTGGDPANAHAAGKAALELKAETIMASASDSALRDDAAAVAASQVGAIPNVRAALLQFQNNFCTHPPGNKKGAVLDGRDIGTVIAPNAPVKIYVTASTEARTDRRYKELLARGEKVSRDDVLMDMKARDERDAKRAISPTKPAVDAVILDTSSMTADEAYEAALKIAQDRLWGI
jgi:cytidylate kinase